MKTRTVAIMYGFTEGQWHGKKLRRLLREQNYQVVQDPTQADIIIAHSGGCYYVPRKLTRKQLVLLINPPYWPEKSLAVRTRNMFVHLATAIRPGNQPFYQAHKTSHNVGYFIRHQKLNRDMVRLAPLYNLANEIKHPKTILVRNSNDPWLTPSLEELRQLNPKLKIVHISGGHDDCWQHPERYIGLLQSKL